MIDIYWYSSVVCFFFVKSHSVNGHNSLMYENIFEHDSMDTLDNVCIHVRHPAPKSTKSARTYFRLNIIESEMRLLCRLIEFKFLHLHHLQDGIPSLSSSRLGQLFMGNCFPLSRLFHYSLISLLILSGFFSFLLLSWKCSLDRKHQLHTYHEFIFWKVCVGGDYPRDLRLHVELISFQDVCGQWVDCSTENGALRTLKLLLIIR